MINNILVKNFKALNTNDAIDVSSCLFLCGPNSSGKSSFIQALLMIAQTFSEQFISNRIVLNGNLTRLGSFSELKNHNTNENNIFISFDLFPEHNSSIQEESLDKITFAFSFGEIKHNTPNDDYHPAISALKIMAVQYSDSSSTEEKVILSINWNKNIQNDSELANIELSSRDNLNLEKVFPDFKFTDISDFEGILPAKLTLEYDISKKISQDLIPYIIDEHKYFVKKTISSEQEKIELSNLLIPRELSKLIFNKIEKKIQEIKEKINIPQEIIDYKRKNKKSSSFIELENFKESFISINYHLTPDEIPTHFLETNIHIKEWQFFVSNLSDSVRQQLIILLDENRVELQELWYSLSDKKTSYAKYSLPILERIRKDITYFFSKSLKYLGPLRNAPQPVYTTNQYDLDSVGLKGEFTASILYRRQSEIITYNSPILYNKSQNIKFEEKEESLYDACISWLSYLGVLEDISINDRGNLGYDLQVKTPDDKKFQDLTHVGVGVSQVLPIVVILLLSKKNDTLIFEQPELHLHPKIQSRLCDLFLATAMLGRQCIIETHSEYMINRLRLRIAQAPDELYIKKYSLYFINKNQGISDFKKIRINKFGAIPDWPDDFFDQTEREIERIFIAASQKNNKEKNKRFDKNANY
ncbi:DUF3696 domain-containing protein [Affinibrenneria salicis]|uniref:DUF3696 domain-containing protein n=1 Tax=Affinibrenneria salicis TaxID=2590031 RepID=A0A5J5G1U6_9GAMM|nr:DUF3696 domain-containing protein [Affinibrenneria salicis]KAA9000462.1 DUF3696 domain-containing protein [Affinibrenneria salicis]